MNDEVQQGPRTPYVPPATVKEMLSRQNFTQQQAWDLLVSAKWGFSGDGDSPYEYDQGDKVIIEYDDLYNIASIGLEALKMLGADHV